MKTIEKLGGRSGVKESITNYDVPASIDTETNRGLRSTVYRFDKNGKVIKVLKRE